MQANKVNTRARSLDYRLQCDNTKPLNISDPNYIGKRLRRQSVSTFCVGAKNGVPLFNHRICKRPDLIWLRVEGAECL